MSLREEWKWLLILVVVCFAVFANSLGGDFVYDDARQILRNPLIQDNALIWKALTSDVWAFKGDGTIVASNYWRPTFTAWHILNFRLFGFSPFGWHVLNVLQHTGVCLLIFGLLRRWQFEMRTAFVIALIFAVHPIHVESVAWISGSPDLLFALLFLGSIYFIDKYAAGGGRVFLAAAFAAYASALGAKEIGIFCLPIFYLILHGREDDKLNRTEKVVPLILIAMIAVGYFLMRWNILGAISRPPDDPVSFTEAIFSIPAIFAFYLRQIFFPYWMAANYPLDPVASPDFWNFFAPLFVSIAGLGALFFAARRTQRGMLAAAVFLIPLIPALNATAFVSDQMVHDRYLYLPILGVLIIVVGLASKYITEQTLLVAGVLIAAVLSIQTISYNRAWQNEFALWSWTRTVDDSAFTTIQLGTMLALNGRYSEAISSFDQSIAKKPLPRAYLGRGRAYALSGRFDKAERDLRFVVDLPAEEVEAYALYQAYESLGIALTGKNDLDKAERTFVKSRRRLPIYSAALTEKLAIVLYQKGDKARALAELESSREQAQRELLPESKNVFLRLGMLYSELGRRDEARIALREFLASTAKIGDANTLSNRQLAAQILGSLN